MLQCKKCKQFLAKNKSDVVQCKGQCQAQYHKACIQDNKFFMKNGMCDKCSVTPSTDSPKVNITYDANAGVEALLAQINNKLNIVFGIKEKMDKLSETVDHYAEKYKELDKFKTECIEKNKKTENKILDLTHKNIYLEKYNKALEERVCILEQKECNKNIELVNVQENETEKIMEVVNKIAKELKQNPAYIEKAWRVGAKKNESKHRPIVVVLQSREARNAWLGCRKQGLTNQKVFKKDNNNNSPIYINENVTRQVRQLFWETKNKLKEHYKYIWIQNGKILIKANDEKNKIEQIRSESDITACIEKNSEE